jgi:hypothetical protein
MEQVKVAAQVRVVVLVAVVLGRVLQKLNRRSSCPSLHFSGSIDGHPSSMSKLCIVKRQLSARTGYSIHQQSRSLDSRGRGPVGQYDHATHHSLGLGLAWKK